MSSGMLKDLQRLSALFLLAFVMCSPPDVVVSGTGSGDEADEVEGLGYGGVTTISVEYLKTLYNNVSTLITQDFAIEGVITANDAFGEFPYSLVIEDSSGAIELMCDADCAASGFVFGATVRVLCSGLWLGSMGGMFSLGDAPYDQYETSTLDEEGVALHLRRCDDEVVTPEPVVVKIANLSSAYILRYVRMDNLMFENYPTTFCSRNEESGQCEYTEHTLTDLQGYTITLSVDKEVIYADDDLPDGVVSLLGIIEYFAGEYRLRISNCGYLL